MNPRELILLSPYRLPTHTTLYLSDDDVAAFLNGYSVLWHPAALAGAAAPPRIGSPYDFEQPVAGQVFAVPESPPLIAPDDWPQRVEAAGAASFKATPDRAASLANLRDALRRLGDAAPPPALLDLDAGRVAPFLGVGFGLLQLEGLFEAMSHENVLDAPTFWQETTNAVAALTGDDADAPRRCLQAAAAKLHEAREILYTSSIHLIDLALLDELPADAWPESFRLGLPLNVLSCAAVLERVAREQPQRLAELKEHLAADLAEVVGGPYRERADALLPLESQLWNLLKGLSVSKDLLGRELRVFARKRFGAHPQLPLLLQTVGLSKAVLLTFDESVLPSHRAPSVNWASLDGKQIDAFTRAPQPADSPQTFFHLTYHLYQTLMHDQSATLALLHRGKPAAPWYTDWLELSRLAPVLGRWETFSTYFSDVSSGDYASPSTADEFHAEYLVERSGGADEPGAAVSGFATQLRARRRLDCAWTLTALYRGLGGKAPDGDAPGEAELADLEEKLEGVAAPPLEELAKAQERAAAALARRLTARGPGRDGWLLLNPCSFKRRVALELPGATAPVPVGGPVRASQLDGSTARVVAEVPALGFAWFPQSGPAGPTPSRGQMRLADERAVRNEFFEAEIDPVSGGLRSLRDHRTRGNRLGQQLVFNPGSALRVRGTQAVSTGPAVGEVVVEGDLLDAQKEVLATFRQRFRAWMGRPVLELRIELTPTRPVEGYPWHAYFGSRFAWRDEGMSLQRGVNGCGEYTSQTRPETPDYLELRNGSQNTVIFPCGLPFHQRHGSRMLDVILVTQGETSQTFDLAIGLDREQPMQTALGLASPAPVAATTQGPPHVGDSGWLFHLDATNLLLTSLRPAGDGVVARLLECAGHAGAAELRCARNPKKAMLVDALGNVLTDLPTEGDAVQLDVARNDLVQVRVEFS